MARWGNQKICSGKAFGKPGFTILYVISKPPACIIDAMTFLDKMNVKKKTFGYLTEITFVSALKDGTSSDRIDIIFDVYKYINR